MNDQNKTKTQLIAELQEMRRRVAELEQDQTRQVNIDQTLRKREEKYKAYIENSPVGIFICDSNGKYTDVNPAACRMTGYSREELLNMSIPGLASPESPPETLEAFNELKKTGQVEIGIILKKKDGADVHASLEAVALPDGSFMAFCCDITGRKQAEQALRESEDRFRAIFETARDSIFIKDRTLRYTEVNPEMERLFDLSAAKIIGQTDEDLFGQEAGAHVKAVDARVLSGEIIEEEHSKPVNGIPHTFHVIKVPMRDESGQITGLCGIARDITGRKQDENERLIFQRLTQKLSNPITMQSAAKIISKEIYQLFNYDAFCFDLVDESKGMLIDLYCEDTDIGMDTPREMPVSSHPLDKIINKDVIFNGKSKLINRKDVSKKGNLYAFGYDSRPSLSLMFVPVKYKNKVIGIITIQSYIVNNYDKTDLDLFQILVDHTGGAIIRLQIEDALRENEFLLKESQKVAGLGSYVLNIPGGILDSSAVLDHIFGIDENYKKDVRGWLNIVHPDDQAMMQNYFTINVLTNHEPFNKEYRIIKVNDQKERWVHGLGKLEFDDTGMPIKMLGTIQDITGRKRAEKNLQERLRHEECLALCSRDLLGGGEDSLTSAIRRLLVAADVDRVYLFRNFEDPENGLCMRQTHEVVALGISSEIDNPFLQDLPYQTGGFGRWAEMLVRGEYISGIVETFPQSERDVLEPQDILSLLILPIEVNGQWYGFVGFDELRSKREWSTEEVQLLRVGAEMVGSFIDRKQAEEELRDSRAKLLQAQYIAKMGNFTWNIHTGAASWSDGMYQLLKYDRGEIINYEKVNKDVHHPEDLERVTRWLMDSIASGKEELIPNEYRLVCKDGEIIHVETNGRIEYEDGKAIKLFGTCLDITERKQTDAQLHRQALVLAQISDHVTITDLSGVITYVNEAFARSLGYSREEFLGRTTEIYGENPERGAAQKEILQKTLKEGSWRGEVVNYTVEGREVIMDVRTQVVHDDNAEPIALCGIATDITERKQAEEEKAQLEKQFRRSQRLETIGTLAGGIAHDFNNILTPIMGYTDMGMSSLSPSDPLFADLEQVLKAANRAKDLVKQILLFSKQENKARQPVALHLIVKEAIKLLRSSIPSTIEIRQRIDASGDKTLADATQIHQVIVNLCTNAFQAMEESGGLLTIELKQVTVDAATAKLHPNLDEAEYARLTVTDTGSGMESATLERIFEPFFTTKTVDKGTGMGLSVVHGIVRSHRGDILVYSEPGKGSTFHIYLPTVKAETETDKKETEVIMGGQESILVIDDDKTVAKMIRKMLERLGYKVDVYNNSPEALNAVRQQPGKYDLVISDLTMPNMTGLDLSEKLQQLHSGFPVIIMTGYGDSLTGATQRQYGIKQVIGKPIGMRELASAIRRVLDK